MSAEYLQDVSITGDSTHDLCVKSRKIFEAVHPKFINLNLDGSEDRQTAAYRTVWIAASRGDREAYEVVAQFNGVHPKNSRKPHLLGPQDPA